MKKVDNSKPLLLEWIEPIFSDNSNQPLRIKTSHKMTDYFDHSATVVYTAYDRAGNNKTCNIAIIVKGWN